MGCVNVIPRLSEHETGNCAATEPDALEEKGRKGKNKPPPDIFFKFETASLSFFSVDCNFESVFRSLSIPFSSYSFLSIPHFPSSLILAQSVHGFVYLLSYLRGGRAV